VNKAKSIKVLCSVEYYYSAELMKHCLCDSLGCKDCCMNTNVLTYLRTYLGVIGMWV